MHEGVINSRDLIVLFTHDYLQSRYTRKEFTSFEEERQSQEERHIIVLRRERKKDECWLSSATCGAAIHTGCSSVNRRAITAIRRKWRGGRGSAEAICSG